MKHIGNGKKKAIMLGKMEILSVIFRKIVVNIQLFF